MTGCGDMKLRTILGVLCMRIRARNKLFIHMYTYALLCITSCGHYGGVDVKCMPNEEGSVEAIVRVYDSGATGGVTCVLVRPINGGDAVSGDIVVYERNNICDVSVRWSGNTLIVGDSPVPATRSKFANGFACGETTVFVQFEPRPSRSAPK